MRICAIRGVAEGGFFIANSLMSDAGGNREIDKLQRCADAVASRGFGIKRQMLPPEMVATLSAELDIAEYSGTGVQTIRAGHVRSVRKIKDLARNSELIAALAADGAPAELAARCLATDVRLVAVTAWMKPATTGTPKPPHQDAAHWLHMTPLEFVTVWISIDRAGIDNGCLYFVPDSHRSGVHRHVRSTRDDAAGLIIPEWSGAGTPVELEPGDASAHLGTTVHWSGRNSSAEPRRGIGFSYCRADVRSSLPELDIRSLRLCRTASPTTHERR
ncbi:phytanoyl-CoA dioxygenase family protein [Nocardia asteroides NBRC 15531]|uniref:Phytanoyl-CoA dioxygenase n=1 Tax=Nocardia asteroides NBRC 15531 TaxID=1110697 RepID=U5ECE2_NOCAS|nr:phytanoyl-CoA dioxygenase family protein [Nocardia asteroides NBRC 15531]GAD87802.1 putative phytanoyl-CoA dioxygenase [Nocardia asteroides NBRC 15531]SFM47822.1 Phytanoyl-CoA dioxygenase (PhyH) [Nocardia asteroides]VEG33560.1 ectoine hydroxylase [Nocardia asteroides]